MQRKSQPRFPNDTLRLAAALLFASATWWALTRSGRPDPFRPPAFLSWAWWTRPLEINAPARLPVVSGTLTSIVVAEDGSTAYVAGQQGLVLRYRADRQAWEEARIPDSLGAPLPPRAPAGATAE